MELNSPYALKPMPKRNLLMSEIGLGSLNEVVTSPFNFHFRKQAGQTTGQALAGTAAGAIGGVAGSLIPMGLSKALPMMAGVMTGPVGMALGLAGSIGASLLAEEVTDHVSGARRQMLKPMGPEVQFNQPQLPLEYKFYDLL